MLLHESSLRHTNRAASQGYVQGMSDLCSPIYIVMGADEELTFWCFVEVMNRMVSRSPSNRMSGFVDIIPGRNKTS